MPFKAGRSGNPAGRPVGVPDHRTSLRSLLEPYARDLVQKAVDLALEGDAQALKLCLDRIIPPLRARDSTVRLDLAVGGLTDQGRSIVEAAGRGEITPAEAAQLLGVLGAFCNVIEVDQLKARLAALEGGSEMRDLTVRHQR